MTKPSIPAASNELEDGAPEDKIKITPMMLRWGAKEFLRYWHPDPIDEEQNAKDAAHDIFMAMLDALEIGRSRKKRKHRP